MPEAMGRSLRAASGAAMTALGPVALAVGFVLIAASDFELVVPNIPGPICAKSEAVCETARRAIRAGWWDIGVPADATTACVPHPGCFPYESNFIAGFNLPGTIRR